MSHRVRSVVLDAQGLSAWIAQDRKAAVLFRRLHDEGAQFVVSANTIVEVSHDRVSLPRLNWTLSQVKVEPVTERSAKAAAKLLKGSGLHGHRYAIDATVAEAALRQPGPVVILTSDIDDMARLCDARVHLLGL